MVRLRAWNANELGVGPSMLAYQPGTGKEPPLAAMMLLFKSIFAVVRCLNKDAVMFSRKCSRKEVEGVAVPLRKWKRDDGESR